MTVENFEKKIAAQLSRLEKNPRFFVEMQKWEHCKRATYRYTLYAESDSAKIFLKTAIKEAESPGLLIDILKAEINNYLQEYVIPKSQELEM